MAYHNPYITGIIIHPRFESQPTRVKWSPQTKCVWVLGVANQVDTVDGSEIRQTHQLRLVVLPHYLQGFIHPRWVFSPDFFSFDSRSAFQVEETSPKNHPRTYGLERVSGLSLICQEPFTGRSARLSNKVSFYKLPYESFTS